MIELLFKRNDGTFVANINNLPYHVTKDDPLFDDAKKQAVKLGSSLLLEPVPEPVVIVYSRLYKATMWKRCTESEYAAIQTELNKVSLRIQAILSDATYLDQNDEMYYMVMAGAIAAVGEERALELLEPEF